MCARRVASSGYMRRVLGAAVVAAPFLWVACSGPTPTTRIEIPTATMPAATEGVTPKPRVDPIPTEPISTASPTTPPTSVPPPAPVAISLETTETEVRRGESFEVRVMVDPRGRGVSGVQVLIKYDPEVLRAHGAVPGVLLGETPAEDGPIIDHALGTLTYAAARLGRTTAPTSQGLFATLSFQVENSALSGTDSTLRIAEVKIPDERIREIPEVAVGEDLSVTVAP